MKSDMYSKHAQKYNRVIADNIYNAFLERPSTKALLGSVNGLNVLDLGAGTGRYAQYFLEQKAKSVTCVDCSPKMVELVKSKFGPAVKSYVQDLSQGLPSESDASADIIVCPLVVHYLDDLSLLFKEVHRVLKPNGYMVLSTHHPFSDFASTLSGNYFEKECITQQWDTIGEPVSVTFYRRSLSDLCNSLTTNNLLISEISEGKVLEKAKEVSIDTYQYLLKNPNFIFIKCGKLVVANKGRI